MLPVGEIRRLARQTLQGRWKDAALLNVIPVLIGLLIVGGSTALFSFFNPDFFGNNLVFGGDPDINATFSLNIREIMSNILTILFATSVSYTLLDMVRYPDYEIDPLKDSLQVFRKGYTLPIIVLYILQSVFTFLWSLLFIIPGVVKAYAYELSYYIYKDATESGHYLSPTDCITRSRELMDGHKGRLFILELSFTGWHFVGAFTLGLGYLFITPYIETSKAIFYEDLLRSR
ncbi:DUF975 family protein [Marinilactibacillus sp. Marseille-P9653]|uniref:DUF975 family protein n=1 Tax=Marinilactibacillus sp. Marseille-P9653 TaxID=2866583 RepID=UPI001CE47BCE|nr:DUF975 family protein [Marinilactibacillus sp. Marseille-P9653]